MKMVDTFIYVGECPICKEKAMFEFESKSLGGHEKEYSQGEEMKTKEIEIFIGEIKKAIAVCPKCQNTLAGDISISEWKYTGIKNIREHQWKKRV
jgi:hypothetical protein